MERPPRLLDVAAVAGVSRQTVSNVLNAPHRVQHETRQRVESVIAQLGYRPHLPARELRRKVTRTLAYLVPTPKHGAVAPILDEFLHGLCEAARDREQRLLLVTGTDDEDACRQLVHLVRSGTVAGVVVAQTEMQDARVAQLGRHGIPLVTFGRTTSTPQHAWVDIDGAGGTGQAVDHLARSGRRRVAYVGFSKSSPTGQDREDGYRRRVRQNRLPFTESLVERGSDTPETGRSAVARWLSSAAPPDAVVAASDTIAAGVLRGAAERGVCVGHEGDLSVIGFDDSPFATLLHPALSSLRQPLAVAAERLVARLLERVHRPGEAPGRDLLQPALIRRESG